MLFFAGSRFLWNSSGMLIVAVMIVEKAAHLRKIFTAIHFKSSDNRACSVLWEEKTLGAFFLCSYGKRYTSLMGCKLPSYESSPIIVCEIFTALIWPEAAR